MGKVIAGIYTPSYADVLAEKVKYQQAERGLALREKQEERAEKVSKAQIDYYNVRNFKLQMEAQLGAGKEMPKPSEITTFWKMFFSGQPALIEKYGKNIGFLDENSKVTQIENGYTISGIEEEPIEITNEALAVLGNISSKKDAAAFTKSKDKAYDFASRFISSYNKRVSTLAEKADRERGELEEEREKIMLLQKTKFVDRADEKLNRIKDKLLKIDEELLQKREQLEKETDREFDMEFAKQEKYDPAIKEEIGNMVHGAIGIMTKTEGEGTPEGGLETYSGVEPQKRVIPIKGAGAIDLNQFVGTE